MLVLVWTSRKVFTKDKVYVLPVRRMLKYNKLSTRRWELSCQFQMIPCYRQTSPGLEKLDNTENIVRHSRRSKVKELVHLSCSVLAFSLYHPTLCTHERAGSGPAHQFHLCLETGFYLAVGKMTGIWCQNARRSITQELHFSEKFSLVQQGSLTRDRRILMNTP